MIARNSNFYYNFAIASCILSAVTTISLLIIVPLLCSRASWDRDQVAIKSERFRTDVNRLWSLMQGNKPVSAPTYFSRVKRSPWDKHVCAECNQLSCPGGMVNLY